jgi:hypothetical protein
MCLTTIIRLAFITINAESQKCDFSFPQSLAWGSFVTALAAGMEAFHIAVIRTGTLLKLSHLLHPGIETNENCTVQQTFYEEENRHVPLKQFQNIKYTLKKYRQFFRR